MAALENAPMVSCFHELEQLVERENLGPFDRFLSFGYKLLNNYGSSSWKPLVWLFLFFWLLSSSLCSTEVRHPVK